MQQLDRWQLPDAGETERMASLVHDCGEGSTSIFNHFQYLCCDLYTSVPRFSQITRLHKQERA
jgi:hypothetical protein